MIYLQLHLRIKKGQSDYIPLELNSTGKIKEIRDEVAKVSSLSADEILLMFCCRLLRDTETVEESGLTVGDVILCLQAQAPRIDEVSPLSTLESYELHRDLARLMRNKNRHAFFRHLQSASFSSTAVSRVAGAWRDPGAIQVLQDTSMLHNYYKGTPDNLGVVFVERPVLGRLLQHVMEVYKNEGPWTTTSRTPVPPSAFSLDALYEADEEDQTHTPRSRSSHGGGGGGGGSGGGGQSSGAGVSGGYGGGYSALPAITPAQLAAALANATSSGSMGGPPNLPSLLPPQRGGGSALPATPSNTPSSASTSSSHTPSSASASTPHQQQPSQLPHITSEMLNTALQSVYGASVGGNSSGPSPVVTSPQTAPPSVPNMEESVRLMAEMGIPDESLSRQALVMTNGDVQAAVELVFAQLNMFD